MSQQRIDRNPILKQLQEEGFAVEVRDTLLLVHEIPYLTALGAVRKGVLVCPLDFDENDNLKPPTDHVMSFIGEAPCNADRSQFAHIIESQSVDLGNGVTANHKFSSKPPRGHYLDFYEKVTTYAAILLAPAQTVEPDVTPRSFAPVETQDDESVFWYRDTASSRAGIGAVTDKLKIGKVAIIGLGGTGSYVLDGVAKCPIGEIHLFDGDVYQSHNAFRSPGAPSIDELKAAPRKVDYFAGIYSKMHRHVVAHPSFVSAENVDELQEMDFVFLCMDRGDQKEVIVDRLEAWGKPFVDVGMGIERVENSLLGILRVTTSTPEKREQFRARVPFMNGDENDEYSKNIQIADLNMLNAALALIRWKKHFGFYLDLDQEHFCAYTIDGNLLTNEDGRE